MAEWFVGHEGERFGPFTAEGVRACVRRLEIREMVYLWSPGFESWRELTAVDGFDDLHGLIWVAVSDEGLPAGPEAVSDALPGTEQDAAAASLPLDELVPKSHAAGPRPAAASVEAPRRRAATGYSTYQPPKRREVPGWLPWAVAAGLVGMTALVVLLAWKGVVHVPGLSERLAYDPAQEHYDQLQQQYASLVEVDRQKIRIAIERAEEARQRAEERRRQQEEARQAREREARERTAGGRAEGPAVGGNDRVGRVRPLAPGAPEAQVMSFDFEQDELLPDDPDNLDLPKSIGQREIEEVIGRHAPEIGACIRRHRERSDVTGELMLSFSITPKGGVEAARVSTPAFDGTPVAACLTQIIRRWRFPAFSGSQLRIDYPLIIR